MSRKHAAIRFNPADYFTFVFDQAIRAAGMPGGYCGFALELAEPPDLALLQRRFQCLARQFPQATARVERRGKRWYWVPTGSEPAVECHVLDERLPSFQQAALAILNQPADLQRDPPLTLHWLSSGDRGCLLLRWVHPLLDARGAKLVLDYLDSDRLERFREGPSLILERLAGWSFWKTLTLAVRAKRHNSRCNRLDSCLPTTAPETAPAELRVRVRRYDGAQSARITELAVQSLGLAGKSLYTIGCLMRAMEAAGPPAAKAGYCIPYAFNLRKPNAPTPVFANHVGCLFAQATREQVRDRPALFAHLLAEHRAALAQELDVAYLPLMWLGQWLAPARYARLLREQHSGGELSSCWFSDIGEVRFAAGGFLGKPITAMFHLTWMTQPPGLALLVGQLNGQLCLSYNALSPAVDAGWLERVIGLMDRELLGETG